MLILLMPKYPAVLPLSASLSPSSVYGVTFTAGLAITATCTTTAAGGVGPYTYAWEYVSGDPATINSPSSAATSFQRLHATPGGYLAGLYRCKVTDSLGSIAYTGNVSVETEYGV